MKMNIRNNKLQKLTDIARMYYVQDMTQNEIAKKYNVSRPLISRMLKEAKELGIVKIEICPPLDEGEYLIERVVERFGITGGVAVPERENDYLTNNEISAAALAFLQGLGQRSLGIGWGYIIGNMISGMEQREPVDGVAAKVCPLIGNSGVGNRNYHANELVRVFAQQVHGAPEYFYAPFIVTTEQERELFEGLECYQSIEKTWRNLDMALVNIGNYPSVPDFATEARYGDILRKGRAVGKILNYYVDVEGKIFHSPDDHALQIPIKLLRQIPHVVGICSANTSPKALAGALRSGLIRYVVAPGNVLKEAMEY